MSSPLLEARGLAKSYDGGRIHALRGVDLTIESGVGATNLNWRHVQESVANFTSTASYDRCGLGWSSACRTARTPSNIAAELHEALQRAQIRPPYILVSHFFGGLVVRRFTLLYPGDAAGLVLNADTHQLRHVEKLSHTCPLVEPPKKYGLSQNRQLTICGNPTDFPTKIGMVA